MIPFDFNIRGKNLWTPLHVCVFNNNLHGVELMLHVQKAEKIDFFSRDIEGRMATDMCPFNSPIFKIITKRQRLLIQEAGKQNYECDKDLSCIDLQHININRFHRRKNKMGKIKTQERS